MLQNLPAAETSGKSWGLPGTYKLGAWCDTAKFPDQRFDTLGMSLANPAGSGVARMDRNNFRFMELSTKRYGARPAGRAW